MKKALALLLAFALPAAYAATPAAGWDKDVRQFDQTYWSAYNQCNIGALDAMNADDLEFYHDMGGAMFGRKSFVEAMQKNICGNPERRVRREAVEKSVKVFPLMGSGKVYGAIVEGEHLFYGGAAGKTDELQGRARFTSLYLLKDGAWKMARVLSYDHGPMQAAADAPEVDLPAGAIERLAGQYLDKNKQVIAISASGNHLLALAGGRNFELYPTGENRFAIKGTPITAQFTLGAQGRGVSFVARERGVVMMEAQAAN